jgi:pimeloyl-ACP methyl ester carboxylesterase
MMASVLRPETWPLPEGGSTPYLDRGGQGATVVFCHATGFNASAYRPFLDALLPSHPLIAPSLRGHGASSLPTDQAPRSWRIYAEEVADLIAGRLEGEVILAGHSMGAVTALLAAGRLSRRPAALVLIEPVILPRWLRVLAFLPAIRRLQHRVPVVRQALARRHVWPDRETIETSYRRNPFFASWHEEALRGYLDEGLRETDAGLTLACHPEWEAATFAAQGHRVWRPLRRAVQRGTPVLIVRATRRSTVPRWAAERLRQRRGIRIEALEGGHLLPQERPQATAGLITDRLEAGPRV